MQGFLICSRCSLRSRIKGTEVGDYHLESVVQDMFSDWCNERLGANGSEHDLSPQVWTRMTDALRLIHATGDQWQCDQSESNVKNSRESTRRADATFMTNTGVRQEQSVVKKDWTRRSSLSVRSVGTKIGLRCTVPSPLNTQVGR